MKQKIFLFLDSSAIGGIESHVLTLANALQADYDVAILFWRKYGTDHPLQQRLLFEGVAFDYLNGSLLKLVRLLKHHPDAILHCHGYKANLLGRLVGVGRNKPVVCTFHNGEVGQGRVRWYTWLDQRTCRYSQNVAVSEIIAMRLKQRCKVMINAVAVAPLLERTNPDIGSIAFVGRLESVKRPDRFINLAKSRPDLSFAVWGTGALEDGLKQGAPANIQWNGLVPSMQPYWQQIDLLVICSDFEGFPMVALEAMAQGVPVLALKLGDLPKLIQHEANGYLVGSEHQLFQSLQHWSCATDATKAQMRLYAHQTVKQRFSLEQLLPWLQNLYQFSDGVKS